MPRRRCAAPCQQQCGSHLGQRGSGQGGSGHGEVHVVLSIHSSGISRRSIQVIIFRLLNLSTSDSQRRCAARADVAHCGLLRMQGATNPCKALYIGARSNGIGPAQ